MVKRDGRHVLGVDVDVDVRERDDGMVASLQCAGPTRMKTGKQMGQWGR